MQISIDLLAGKPNRIAVAGRYFVLVDTGAVTSVKLRFALTDGNTEDIEQAGRGLQLRILQGAFNGIEATAAADTTLNFLVSDNPVEFNFLDGSTVAIAGQVELTRGSPGAPLSVTAVTASDAPATAATAAAAIPVTSAGAALVAVNAARRELRFFNQGPDTVAIGPAGTTWAQRAVVLEVGDLWTETKGANLAWSAITDAGKTATVGIQGVNA